jgi:ribosomal protein S18 acetylase RimI-like enzyme
VEPLDNPAWHALTGPQARFAEGDGLARRYQPDVAGFAALSDEQPPDAWDALRGLVGPQTGTVLFRADGLAVPAGWTDRLRLPTLQMVARAPIGEPDAAFETLGDGDAPEMLELVTRTRPGPFFARTHALGTYLGLREGGHLVAMAGERMHFAGHTEISAVCTDERARKRRLASRLIRAVAAGIEARGETAMLHVLASNDTAIRVYEALGFDTRVAFDVVILESPT